MDPARDPRSDSDSALSRRSARPPSFFSRARIWLRPPRRLRPTRAGWCFFLLTFGVGFAALNTGNNLLYLVLSLMLAFLVLSGVLSEMALRGIEVRRRLPRELFAERDARISLEVCNEQRRGTAFAIVVEDRVARPGETDRPAGRVFALRLPPGASESRTYVTRLPERGDVEFRGVVVSTRFPFGLFSKSLLIELEERAVVYPAVDPVNAVARGAAREGEAEPERRHDRGAGASVVGVREFVPGDDRRRIDWKTSARSGELFVRELEREQSAEIEVELAADAGGAAAFEGAVRRAASQVVAHLDAGCRVGLRAPAERFEPDFGPRQRARLLGFLARVAPLATPRSS